MKPGSILDLKKVKIYYPFFKGKNGEMNSLKVESEWLVAYLLLCDVVMLPPREFLLRKIIKDNLKIANQQKLIRYLFQTGRVITASTKESIRDLKDLTEYYHPTEFIDVKDTDLYIYDRNEEYQRYGVQYKKVTKVKKARSYP